MPAISSLTRPDVVEAVVDIRGEQVRVRFDRAKVTLGWARELREAEKTADAGRLAAGFQEVLIEWDITNEDGTPYAPTVENMERMPAAVLGELFGSINEAAAPGEQEGKASPATTPTVSSDSTPAQETHQNGAVTSTLPPASASLSTS